MRAPAPEAWRGLVAAAVLATGLFSAGSGTAAAESASSAHAATTATGPARATHRATPAQTAPEVRTVATDLAVPWGIDFLPDGHALVTERDSARLLDVSPAGQVTTVATVVGVQPGGEGGLLGLAVSPTFASDRYVYLYFTAASDNRIVRVTYANGQIGPQQVVLSGLPKGTIHNGGRIAFGPDGMLYAGVGETGNTGLSQDLSSLGGKILRITPTGAPAPGNPFGTRVWSYGHRNVQGLAWDDEGRLFATEFGQNTLDEINRIEPGNNYGWPIVEGPGGGSAYTDPLVTWTPAEASPSGAAIVDDSLWVAGLRGRRLWQVPLTGDGGVGTPVAHLAGEYGRLRNAAAAPDGTLWVTTSNRDGRGTPTTGDDRILALALGDGGPGEPGEQACVTATNSAHVSAGRATVTFIFVRAVGSRDFLGLRSSTTSVRETAPGHWERVGSCT
ncbi:MAG TPA: PQQ-dependent sugar dehydrogenase [Acidimicrobiales bacterium]|nr:PQQ-dependent sugar dehydrogenase [Acidimicrobiales bacterium]